MVEHLPNKSQALVQTSVPPKKKKEKENNFMPRN
jgi:hypothetical protein